jgi:putative peptide zinc metalloprotease protein
MNAAVETDLERRKQVRLRLRRDLSVTPQKYEGKTYRVVKDPVNLRYYRLDDKHYFIVTQLDGGHTLEDIQKEFERRFAPDRLTLEQLESFAQQLITAGLAQNDSPHAGKHLFEQRRKRRRNEWLQALTNVLYIKVPLYDPDKLLARMVPYLRWIFTTWFMAVSAAVMLSAVVLVLTHFATFRDRLPAFHEFFNFRTIFNIWIALGVVKVIHEFGHGLACKVFGGEVHEMGLLLLCLTPCLYCNVSDAWILPSKWKRIVISFAGIYVELMIAAVATFVWWNSVSQPYLHNLSLCLMMVCSVSTIVFNGNPLMRYDGYYVLFDWLEVPNLRDRANRFLKHLLQEHCLGIEVPPEPYMAPRRRVLFVFYAVASFLYKWVITFAILYMFYNLLRPVGLGTVSAMLALAAFASLVGWPVCRMAKAYHQRGRLPDMKPRRVTVTASVIGALVLCFLFVPLPISRVRQVGLVQVQPEALEQVFVQEPGILKALYVRDGQEVQAGDLLAEFTSLDLETQLSQAQSEHEVRVARCKALQEEIAETTDPQQRVQSESALTRAAGERSQYAAVVEMYDQRLRRLQLRAPRAGVVMAPPRLEDIGKLWDREQPTPFCGIGDPSRLQVLLPVATAAYELLKDDAAHGAELPATICVQGRGGRRCVGRLATLPAAEAKDVPLALTSKAGGPLAVKPPANPDALVPQSQQYLVTVNFEEADPAVCPGTLAQVKIHCRWRTAAWWVWRAISSTFDLGLI